EATVRAFLAGSDLLLIPADPDSAVLAMTAAVAAGRVTPQRLAQSVRRVLEIKRRLGLFERRTVPLDSIPHVVGSKRFQDAANDIAVRSLTLVRDVGGRLHALRGHPGRLALIAYADEANASVGLFLTDLLRQGGDTVEYFRLWPMSGTLSYDSARTTIARAPATSGAGIPRAGPSSLGLDSTRLADVVAYVRAEVDSGAFPGAVLAVGRHGRLALLAPVGHYGVDDPRPVEVGTLYDLASLTKVVGLTTACMLLVDSGLLELDAPIERYVPTFRGSMKDRVTVRQLLTHSAGLVADL